MNSIKYINFSGGGVKGFSLIGIQQFLEQQNLLNDLIAISGSSIGSIFALCLSIGMTSDEIKFLFFNLDLEKLIGFDIEAIINIPTFFGIHNTSDLTKILLTQILNKTQLVNPTFQELFSYTNIKLIVTGSNLTKSHIEFFSVDSTPEMFVADAVSISSSFPIIFEPTLMNNCYYADGGIFANCIFNYFDSIYNDANQHAFGVIFQYSSTIDDKFNYKINSFYEYLNSILEGMIYTCNKEYYDKDGNIDPRMIQIIIDDNIPTMSTKLTTEQKEQLVLNGFQAMEKYYNKSA